MKWLFRLLNVNPVEPICATCEVLKEQVAYLRYQNEQLLKGILEAPKDEMQPAVAPPHHEEELEAIKPKIIPWHVRKQMLESEDRQKAMLLKKSAEDRAAAINELEGRLKVNALDLNQGDANVRKSESIETDGDEHQQEEVKQG